MSVNLSHRILTTIDDHALPRIRQLYQSAFPVTERKPIDCLEQMILQPIYKLVVVESDDVPVGFAAVFVPVDPTDAALLEYLAVEVDYQSKGAGSHLVRFALQLANGRPLLAEVESLGDAQSIRRKDFYRRHGFRMVNGLDYLLPLADAPQMSLMLANSPLELTHDTLARWIATIFKHVYGCGQHDTRLQQMIAAMPPNITVG